jgi:xylan 1,4-beta-xylosidase
MRNLARSVISGALLALATPAHAAAPVRVSVDATAPGAPLERVWAFHGYDEINYTTLPEGAALLGTLAALHTAPVHVRTHFLFNTGDGTPQMKWGSTGVYAEDSSGTPVYSWALTDGILDTLVGTGTLPLVELGFMPEVLSTHPAPYQNSATTSLDGGCFYPPKDYTKWASLVRTWAGHAAERYPDAESSWLWELWNEPDIPYWHGTFEDYAKLYDYTESALHEVMPGAVLGGPAVASPDRDFLPQFLEHCANGTNAVTGATGTRLDLVSFHAKGGVGVVGDHVELNLGNQLRLHRAGMSAVAAVSSFARTPIYITEADPDGCAACPSTSSPEDAYRNSTAYGAYEVALMKHSLELAAELGVNLGGVLTWAFTFPGTPYFAGYRALATNGIHLPVLSAFELLGQLQGARLPLSSTGALALDDIVANGVRAEPEVDGMATLDGEKIRILLWNYHDDLVPTDPAPVHLALRVPPSFGGRVRVSHQRVDESHGDAYTVWVTQGMPVTPSAEQTAALMQSMDPSPLAPDTSRAVSGGSVAIDFDLPRFGVSLVTIDRDPTAGEGGAGAGADAAMSESAHGCGCRVARPSDRAFASGPLVALGLVILAAFGRARKLVQRNRARRATAFRRDYYRRFHTPSALGRSRHGRGIRLDFQRLQQRLGHACQRRRHRRHGR